MKSAFVTFLASTLFGGWAVLFLVWGIHVLVRHEYLTTIVMLGGAVFCVALVTALLIIRSNHATWRGQFDATGSLFRPDRTVDVLYQAGGVGALVAMALYAVGAPLGRVDVPTPAGMRGYFPFICAAGAISGAAGLVKTRARGGVSYLRLSPNGFEMAQGFSATPVGWDTVKDVSDRYPRGSIPARGTIVVTTSDGRTRTLAADSYTPGGQALRELVRFYWQHPDVRAELTDGRALERLRQERFAGAP